MERKEENTKEVKAFIRENASMFWYIRDDAKENISHDVLVEFMLNYGDTKQIKKMFELLGINHVADVFYKNTAAGRRINYFPRVVHYFNLYFKRHAHRNSVGESS